MSDYYIKSKGEERGPFAHSQLRSMWDSGAITSDTLFRQRESQDWQPIAELFETSDVAAEPSVPKSDAAATAATTTSPKKSQAGAIAFLIILVLAIAAIFFGSVHIITGGSLDSPRIVHKESFGFSETFVNIDTITHMPWIAAESRYPLSCAVLKREGLIQSDEEFRQRRDKEMKDEIQKQLQSLTNN